MISEDSVRFVEWWYPDHFDVDPTKAFIKFASGASAFVALYLPYDIAIPRFVVSDTPTAYTDQKDIYFPAVWLTRSWIGKFNTKMLNESLPLSASMLVLINGGILHELGHIINSNGLMHSVIAEAERRGYHSTTTASIRGIAQLVEDVFLTKWWEVCDPHVAKFHWAINEFHFTDEGITRLIGEELAPPKLPGWPSISFLRDVSVEMASFKHPKVLEMAVNSAAPFISELANAFASIDASMSKPQRCTIVFDIFDLFQRYAAEGKKESGEGSDADDDANKQGNEPKDAKKKQDPDKMSDGTYNCVAVKGDDSGWDDDERPAAAGSASLSTHMAQELVTSLNSSLMKAMLGDRGRLNQIRTTEKNDPQTTISIHRHTTEGNVFIGGRSSNAKLDHRFLAFGSLLRFMRATRGGFEPRMKSGKLDKHALHHIVTDGKVMKRRNDEDGDYAVDVEIIQLIDWSGSMSGVDEFPGDWDGSGNVTKRMCSFRDAVTGAATGAAIAMTRGNIPNSLFSHTTHPSDYGRPHICDIYRFRMGIQTDIILPNDLLEHVNNVSRSVDGLSNSDHLAIREVAKAFTPRRNLKVLIVYSDGAPTPRGYSDDSAIVITAAEVANLRFKGISVLSMSLIPSVWECNDAIYGSDNNVHLSAGSDITKILTTTIRRLSTRR